MVYAGGSGQLTGRVVTILVLLQGDSGGPVVWYMPAARRHLLVGVISVGIGCGAHFPGINTRVAPYVRWILANR